MTPVRLRVYGAVPMLETANSRSTATGAQSATSTDRLVIKLLAENARLRERVAELEGSQELAYRDPLTNLRNRRFFQERIDEELSRSRRTGLGGTLLLIDLDEPAHTGDRERRAARDAVLKQFSAGLTRLLRVEDVLCRFEGDSFVAVLPGADLERSREVVRRLRGHLATPFATGAACWPASGTDRDTLLAVADAALHDEKQQRRRMGHLSVA